MTRRTVTLRFKSSPGKVTPWLELEDGTQVLAEPYSQDQVMEYLTTGTLPKRVRPKNRPKLLRDDAVVALHYVLLAPKFRKQRGGAKVARADVAAAWKISDQRVRAAIRTEGPWAREFVAGEPAEEARAMLTRVSAYAAEYAEDLAPLDHPK